MRDLCKFIYWKICKSFLIQQVFPERIGCFSVESKRILKYQEPPIEIVKECSSLAWSRGFKAFAVRNGSECLGDKNLLSMLTRLNSSKGCLGGRGFQDVSDVYRLTSKKGFHSALWKMFIFLSLNYPMRFSLTHLCNLFINLSIHRSISLILSCSRWPDYISRHLWVLSFNITNQI